MPLLGFAIDGVDGVDVATDKVEEAEPALSIA